MKTELVTLPERMILGIPHKGANEYDKIAAVWNELYERIGEIDHIKNEDDFYGLCEPLYSGENNINYLAGVEVTAIHNIPKGMQAWFVTHKLYLEYHHTGDASTIGSSFDKIYHDILPKMGLHPSDDYDFEVYSKAFYEAEEPVVLLYVPVQQEKPLDKNSDPYRKVRKQMMDETKMELEGDV